MAPPGAVNRQQLLPKPSTYSCSGTSGRSQRDSYTIRGSPSDRGRTSISIGTGESVSYVNSQPTRTWTGCTRPGPRSLGNAPCCTDRPPLLESYHTQPARSGGTSKIHK